MNNAFGQQRDDAPSMSSSKALRSFSVDASGKGTYALFFAIPAPLTIVAGRLGKVTLPKGWSIYVGSALGPGGLRARIQRHRAPAKRAHWHIDALSNRLRPLFWLFLADGTRRECDWAQALASHPQAAIPAPHFGSSDCTRGCPAHLIAFPETVPLKALVQLIAAESAASTVPLSLGAEPNAHGLERAFGL